MIAIADTGPLLYLSLIDRNELLPQIFAKIAVPQAVAEELSHPFTPIKAAALIEHRPSWLEMLPVPQRIHPSIARLGRGECQAITLALSIPSALLLLDDEDAKKVATQTMGIAASGTIGVLYEAAKNDLVPFTATDFDGSIDRLFTTSFRHSRSLLFKIEALKRDLRGVL